MATYDARKLADLRARGIMPPAVHYRAPREGEPNGALCRQSGPTRRWASEVTCAKCLDMIATLHPSEN